MELVSIEGDMWNSYMIQSIRHSWSLSDVLINVYIFKYFRFPGQYDRVYKYSAELLQTVRE